MIKKGNRVKGYLEKLMFLQQLKDEDFMEFLSNFDMKDVEIIERNDEKVILKATLNYGDNSTEFYEASDSNFKLKGANGVNGEISNQWKSFLYGKLPSEIKAEYFQRACVGVEEVFKKIINGIKYDDKDALRILNRYFKKKNTNWLEGQELTNRAYSDTEFSILMALTKSFNAFSCTHCLSIRAIDIYGNEHWYNIEILDEIKSIIICIPGTYMQVDSKEKEIRFLQWMIRNNEIEQFEQIGYIGEKIALKKLLTEYHIFYFKHTKENESEIFSVNIYDVARMNEKINLKLEEEITKCLNSLDDVLNKPFSYFYNNYKSIYKEIVFEQFKDMVVLKNNKELCKKVENYIKSDKINDDAIISFLTSIYVKNLFEENKRMDSLDYTSVSFGLYKMVEIVLNQIINDCWGTVVVKDDNGKILYGNYKKHELGAMQFIYDRGIMPMLLQEFNNDGETKRKLEKIKDDINSWRTKYRNGFCHKDAQTNKEFCEEVELFAKEFIVEIVEWLLTNKET